MSLPDPQEVSEHVATRWPTRPMSPDAVAIVLAAAKVSEEAGEVSGAAVKWCEGRVSMVDLADEMADLVITVLSLAGRVGIADIEGLVAARWAEVKAR